VTKRYAEGTTVPVPGIDWLERWRIARSVVRSFLRIETLQDPTPQQVTAWLLPRLREDLMHCGCSEHAAVYARAERCVTILEAEERVAPRRLS